MDLDKNLGNILQQAQAMQGKFTQMQGELAKKTVEASAGGGMVVAIVNGKQQLVGLKIEPEVITPDDGEMLQDLVMAAINQALKRSQEMMQQEMSKLTGGLNIPGIFPG